MTVTNTGDTAGKDVVEVYYNPPYIDGGIEKASKNLVAFEKTEKLEPGASETVKIEFDDDDMASYDDKDYDDADWEKLLDQLTFDDMDNLIANGGYGTPAVSSVGKIQLTDADGPASLNNNFTGVGSIGFPASTAFACTWNKDLAKQFGEMIGDMAHDMHVAGWYAPAMNIHRNAFSGRTFEYFSEDALLSGAMASNEIAGAKEKGVYSFMKHFALNDQETKRTEMLCTWTNEQAMRTAAHNILYTAANSWQYADGEPKVATPIWKTAMYVAWGVTAILVIALEALAIKRYMDRKKAKAEVTA